MGSHFVLDSNEFCKNPILLRIKCRNLQEISQKTARWSRKSHFGAVLRKFWNQNPILPKSHFIGNLLYTICDSVGFAVERARLVASMHVLIANDFWLLIEQVPSSPPLCLWLWGMKCNSNQTSEPSENPNGEHENRSSAVRSAADVWKIEIFRISRAILERLEGQNGSESVGNGLYTWFQLPKQLENVEDPLFRTNKLQNSDFPSVWSAVLNFAISVLLVMFSSDSNHPEHSFCCFCLPLCLLEAIVQGEKSHKLSKPFSSWNWSTRNFQDRKHSQYQFPVLQCQTLRCFLNVPTTTARPRW